MIEIMIVVVILGIAVGLAVPGMSGMVNRNRVDRLAVEIAADISYARATASRAAQPVQVDVRASGYSIVRNGVVIKQVNVSAEHPGATLGYRPAAASSGVLGSLRFNSRGLLQSTGIDTVVISRAGTTVKLPVLVAGKVKRGH